MKKYFSLLVAFVAFLSSCNNDDIGSSYTKDEHYYETFTYNVNTQPVFDEFNATTTIRNRFLSGELGNFQIGVFTYIYDTNGDLKETRSSYNQTFGSETYEFTLEDGRYTAVSVEMLVDKDNNYQSPRFEIKGQNKLSTLEIAYRTYTGSDNNTYYYSTSLWYQCIGISTQTINVGRSMSAVTVAPNPIGVIVNCSFYNFNNSTYDYLLLRTKNAPIGRYLDPSKTGDERFKYDSYNSGTTVTVREYVYKATMSEEENIDVYLLEEGTDIDCRLGARHYPNNWYTNGQRSSFEDGKTYYAGLYYVGGSETGGADIYGGIFDNTSEYTTWYNTAKNMYQPTALSGLIEPCITWGSSVSTVQSNMTGYTLEVGSAGQAVASASDSTYYIAYSATAPLYAIYYYFSSQTTGLKEADVYYLKSEISQDKMLELLRTNYDYIYDSDGTYLFGTKDSKSYVMLMEPIGYEDSFWLVAYLDVSSSNTSSTPAYSDMKSEVTERSTKVLSSLRRAENVASPFAFLDQMKDRKFCSIK